MDCEEKPSEPESDNEAKKSKRLRSATKSASIRRVESDKYDLSSLSDVSEYSEDEWVVSSKKKRGKAQRIIPKQTLKLKLIEKTKKLRELSKQSATPVAEQAKVEEISQTSVDDKGRVGSASAVETSDKPPAVKLIEKTEKLREPCEQSTTPVVQRAKLEEISQILIDDKGRVGSASAMEMSEDCKPRVDKLIEFNYSLNDSSSVTASMKKEATDQKKRVDNRMKIECDREPVVIEYSINRSQISNAPSQYYSPSTSQTDLTPISSQSLSAKNSLNAKNGRVYSTKLDNAAAVSYRAKPPQKNVFCPQVGSNSNSSSSTCTQSETNVQVFNNIALKRREASEMKKNCASSQRTVDGRSSRIPPSMGPNFFRTVKNSKINNAPINRTRNMKIPSSDQNLRSSDVRKIIKNDIESTVVRNDASSNRTGPLSMTKTSTFVLNKLSSISPGGTVIHTGTGSVTITPRQTSSEKPPTQRKLFKNEIEGTISVRSIERSLRYVVNLANGTYVVLSDLQVKKLREQHDGALPTKLRIPVPCDVADKIEPSFLIED